MKPPYQITLFNSFKLRDLEKAHAILMNGLIESASKLKATNVGIVKRLKVEHIAPGGALVKDLMKDLFGYLKIESYYVRIVSVRTDLAERIIYSILKIYLLLRQAGI